MFRRLYPATHIVYRLEAFNSVLLLNLSENPNLVYNIVRAHKTFEDLGTFTLAGGLRDIRRRELAKEELSRGSVDKGKSRASSLENETPSDDKARLLRSESTNSIDRTSVDIEAQRHSRSSDERTTGRPLTSPTIPDASMTDLQQTGPSEKARGKMRAGRTISEDLTGSLERLAATGVGRNGFVPTQEWVSTPSHLHVTCLTLFQVTSWQQG